MKRKLSRLLIVFTVLSSFVISAQAAPENYTFDPHHSYVLWHANHFGFSNPSGKFPVEGTLVFDQAKPKDSKVNVTIKTADLSTGNAEFDQHLKDKLFFDVNQFTTVTFVSDKVDMIGKDKAKVHGTLTIRGVSKPETLDVKINKIGINPINNKQTIGFTATAMVKRSDFGMTALIPGVSDEVKIDIEAEANKVG